MLSAGRYQGSERLDKYVLREYEFYSLKVIFIIFQSNFSTCFVSCKFQKNYRDLYNSFVPLIWTWFIKIVIFELIFITLITVLQVSRLFGITSKDKKKTYLDFLIWVSFLWWLWLWLINNFIFITSWET